MLKCLTDIRGRLHQRRKKKKMWQIHSTHSRRFLALQSHLKRKPRHKNTNSIFYFYRVTETIGDRFEMKWSTNKNTLNFFYFFIFLNCNNLIISYLPSDSAVQNIPDWLKNPTLISLRYLALNLSVETIWTETWLKEILRGNSHGKYRLSIKMVKQKFVQLWKGEWTEVVFIRSDDRFIYLFSQCWVNSCWSRFIVLHHGRRSFRGGLHNIVSDVRSHFLKFPLKHHKYLYIFSFYIIPNMTHKKRLSSLGLSRLQFWTETARHLIFTSCNNAVYACI